MSSESASCLLTMTPAPALLDCLFVQGKRHKIILLHTHTHRRRQRHICAAQIHKCIYLIWANNYFWAQAGRQKDRQGEKGRQTEKREGGKSVREAPKTCICFVGAACAAAVCKIFEIISVKYLHRNYLFACGRRRAKITSSRFNWEPQEARPSV